MGPEITLNQCMEWAINLKLINLTIVVDQLVS